MKKNIVYKILFTENIETNTKPYYYIGSKSFCDVIDNVIYDKRDKPYLTSGNYSKFYMQNKKYEVEVLYESDVYDNILKIEKDFQILEDAINSDLYSNLAYADGGNYTNPNYVTVKDEKTNLVYRVTKNEFNNNDNLVGITKNHIKIFKDGVQSSAYKYDIDKYLKDGWQIGEYDTTYKKLENNGFYGKKHNNITKHKMKKRLYDFYKTDKGLEFRKKLSENAKKRFANTKPSDETIKKALKIAHENWKQRQTCYNIITGEKINIDRCHWNNLLNRKIWVSGEKFNNIQRGKYKCIYCGVESLSKVNIERWHNNNCKLIKEQWIPWENETCNFKLSIYYNLDKYIDCSNMYSKKTKVKKILEILPIKPKDETQMRFATRMFKKIIDQKFNTNSISWLKFKQKYEKENNEN